MLSPEIRHIHPALLSQKKCSIYGHCIGVFAISVAVLRTGYSLPCEAVSSHHSSVSHKLNETEKRKKLEQEGDLFFAILRY